MKKKLFFILNFIFFLIMMFLIYKEIEKSKMINKKIEDVKNQINNIKLDLNLVLIQINLYKNPEYLKSVLLKNYLMNPKEFILVIKMD